MPRYRIIWTWIFCKKFGMRNNTHASKTGPVSPFFTKTSGFAGQKFKLQNLMNPNRLVGRFDRLVLAKPRKCMGKWKMERKMSKELVFHLLNICNNIRYRWIIIYDAYPTHNKYIVNMLRYVFTIYNYPTCTLIMQYRTYNRYSTQRNINCTHLVVCI
jgi:hypothetical protein